MGNKQKHLKHLLPFVPSEYNTYIEPFVGSGSLFLHLAPEKWIINDLNSDLIYIWKDIRNHHEEVLKTMQDFVDSTKGMTKDQLLLHCRKTTDQINFMKPSPQKTGLILILKKYVYVGDIFIKKKYYFSGLKKKLESNYLDINYKENLICINKFLQHSGKIYNQDYKKTLEKAKEGDFIFLDPPYIENTVTIYYNKNQNFNGFLNGILEEVKKLDAKGVKWMMTQNDSKLIRQTFKDYIIKSYDVYRFYTNSHIKELIIMNYKR